MIFVDTIRCHKINQRDIPRAKFQKALMFFEVGFISHYFAGKIYNVQTHRGPNEITASKGTEAA